MKKQATEAKVKTGADADVIGLAAFSALLTHILEQLRSIDDRLEAIETQTGWRSTQYDIERLLRFVDELRKKDCDNKALQQFAEMEHYIESLCNPQSAAEKRATRAIIERIVCHRWEAHHWERNGQRMAEYIVNGMRETFASLAWENWHFGAKTNETVKQIAERLREAGLGKNVAAQDHGSKAAS